MNQSDIPEILTRLQSDEDATRKLAIFKLQASINDPSIADVFISSGGLQVLRQMIMTTTGNTLAYALSALSRLLEVEMGWEIFESSGSAALIERVVGLIVTHPLVNILRGAISILVAIVSHSQSSGESGQTLGIFGFPALKPAIAVYPQFFEMVVSQLKSADHLLCSNSLMLLNCLIRDTVCRAGSTELNSEKQNKPTEDWQEFIKKLQDLGMVPAVYELMQSSSVQDMTNALLEFQAVSKLLLKKRRDTEVDLEISEHRDILEKIYQASQKKEEKNKQNGLSENDQLSSQEKTENKKQNSEKWRKIGFQTESPAWEFEQTGILGMIDLAHFIARNEDGFQRLLKEQTTWPVDKRCPIARASLSVTAILYDHFEIERPDQEDVKNYLAPDGIKNYTNLFRPFLLQWSRIHVKSLNSFITLWKQVGAEQQDFGKVVELLRILVDKVLGGSTRTKDIQEVEEELTEFDYHQLRHLQIDILNMAFEDEWGQHLSQIRGELRNEALQFMKEQRIRILIQGSWFPRAESGSDGIDGQNELEYSPRWRYIKLSCNRRYLHYGDFDSQVVKYPQIDSLNQKIDLRTISSVVSNVSATGNEDSGTGTPTTEVTARPLEAQSTMRRITIKCYVSLQDAQPHSLDNSDRMIAEKPVLILFPADENLTSAWLDGLLMLLNQAPVTPETNQLIDFICEYGLKIRLLNIRMDDLLEPRDGAGVVPSREGLDNEYFYQI